MCRQTLQDNIEGLRRNIRKINEQIDDMVRYGHDDGECFPCPDNEYMSRQLQPLEDQLERKRNMLNVLVVRSEGLKPGKYRMIKVKVPCTCGNGRTTLFSVGRCLCMERDCPGRGVCHACGGTNRVWGRKKMVTRDWPPVVTNIKWNIRF